MGHPAPLDISQGRYQTSTSLSREERRPPEREGTLRASVTLEWDATKERFSGQETHCRECVDARSAAGMRGKNETSLEMENSL
jgi:hypothetical protein